MLKQAQTTQYFQPTTTNAPVAPPPHLLYRVPHAPRPHRNLHLKCVAAPGRAGGAKGGTRWAHAQRMRNGCAALPAGQRPNLPGCSPGAPAHPLLLHSGMIVSRACLRKSLKEPVRSDTCSTGGGEAQQGRRDFIDML